MRRDRRAVVFGATMLVARGAGAADELSGADKLRAMYSAEFRFTPEGVPVVPVAITDGAAAVTISCASGLRVLPDGEGGADIRADDVWHVRAASARPAKLRHWTTVWRGRLVDGAGAEAARQEDTWRRDAQDAKSGARGLEVRSFEQGTLFGVSGEVIDRRERVVAVGPFATADEAERTASRLGTRLAPSGGGVFTELVDRPHGRLEATGGVRMTRVVNEGALWFVPIGDAPLRVEWTGKRAGQGTYHGRVYVTFDKRGDLAAVNAVPEDRLLAGLVPAEIFPSAPDEALKAQAVAARNELLAKIGTRHVGDPFRLCAETHCQVYAGAARETPRTTAAVKATRGEVLFSRDGRDLIDAVYSANCGGHTETSGNVWPPTPLFVPLPGRRDAPGSDAFAAGITEASLRRFLDEAPASYCSQARIGAADRYRWTVTRSAAELSRLLEAHHVRVGALEAVHVLERGVSGRATAVRLVGRAGEAVVRGELRIRQTFGGLRSSMFLVDVAAGVATFRGGGFGHGVGMCQTGAMGMAEAGKSYREILAHYYAGAALRKLW